MVSAQVLLNYYATCHSVYQPPASEHNDLTSPLKGRLISILRRGVEHRCMKNVTIACARENSALCAILTSRLKLDVMLISATGSNVLSRAKICPQGTSGLNTRLHIVSISLNDKSRYCYQTCF